MEDLTQDTYEQLIMKFMKANDDFLQESIKFHFPSHVSQAFEAKKNYLRSVMSELDKRRMQSLKNGDAFHQQTRAQSE
jgi:hypothetical protein